MLPFTVFGQPKSEINEERDPALQAIDRMEDALGNLFQDEVEDPGLIGENIVVNASRSSK
ncbi:hypothetical protein N7530_009842 [Penicillium desertorum]|uniref:Uncharacterized protein n=1 Tax=Penicillium desertorum TaxID=1303715 RepID=A0A9W9WJD9_9EURO|nr:hypothetical protein N7530_009842 [Penicillium desertorum]